MSRSIRVVLWIIAFLVVLSFFSFIFPSLMGWILTWIIFFGIFEYFGHRFRHTVQTFNQVLESVAQRGGDLSTVAVAFSRRGPLSGRCYEFARRLMMGQEPLEAAARARVPLQLSTAVAMQGGRPTNDTDDKTIIATDLTRTDLTRDSFDQSLGRYHRLIGGTIDGVGRNLYLMITVVTAVLVMTFTDTFVMPTMEQMMEEFGMDDGNAFRFRSSSAIWIVFLIMSGFFLIVRPIMRRGGLGRFWLPNWVPPSPAVARNRSQLLHGLADAVDSGWPIGRALTVAHVISVDPGQRLRLQRAMEWIEQGRSPAQAIASAGWISGDDVAWIDGASPRRTAGMLRTIGDREMRNAMFRRSWIGNVAFPICIFVIATIVGFYAWDFINALTRFVQFGAGS